jgi:hypothetical protein
MRLWLPILLFTFAFIPACSHASVVGSTRTDRLTNGLIIHSTFDGKDMTNGRANDVSGNGNAGYLIGIATTSFYTTGKIGQGFNFDGIDDRVNLGDPAASLDNRTTLSVSAWVKSSTADITSASKAIVNKSRSVSGFSGWNLLVDTSEKFNFRVSDGVTTASAVSDASFADTKWHHVVGVYNGTDIKIYVDGASADSTPPSFTATIPTLNRSLCIGYAPGNVSDCSSSGVTTQFAGAIDDVRIYNRELSATEVVQLYKIGAQALTTGVSRTDRLTSGLVGYWTFDGKDMAGGRVADISGNNKTGYFNSISTTTVYRLGKIGQGINLDSVNDTVDITGFTGLDGASQATVSFWMKPNSRKAIMSQWNTHRLFDVSFSGTSVAMSWRYGGTGSTGTTLSSICPSGTYALGVWTHVTFRYNSGVSECWINGVYQSSTGGGGTLNSSVTETLRIGWNNSPSFFDGVLDDVRIYNTSLSTTSIQQLYNSGGVKTQTTRTDRLTSGLIGYWTFDGKDMPNGRASDVSGNGNTMTLASISTTTFYAPGKIGQGLNFDGVNDRAFTSSNIVGTGATTLSAWIFPKSFGELSVGEVFSAGNTRLRVLSTNSKFSFSSNNFSNQADSANNSVQLNKWTHIAVTRAADGTANFYVNGVLSGTADQNSGTPSSNSNPTEIGNNLTAAVTFDGIIDEARIYNRLLSASEIQQLYNMTK